MKSEKSLWELVDEAAARVARRDAETLLMHVLGCERSWLLAHREDEVDTTRAETFRALVARRTAQEPLQYIVGEQEFYGLRLCVTRDTLIPRPETEHLVEAVLLWVAAFQARQAKQATAPHPLATKLPKDGPPVSFGSPPETIRIVDVGTGTGAIALALATHLPAADVVACDISAAALAVARNNAAALGLDVRVQLVQSDLLAFAGGETFDVVVSNPPYVPAGDAATMQAEVVQHEPHSALFAGDDGLAVYRRLIPQAHAVLREGGLLAMEFGYGQREAMVELLRGWNAVSFVDDYAGIPRVMVAERA